MHKIAIPQAAVDRVLKRRDSLHVFNDIEPSRTAHIVVDLQNGFMVAGQPAEIAAARDIIPNVNRISAALRAAGGLVVYIQNTIDANAKQAWSNWFTYMSGAKRQEAMDAAFAEGSFGHSLWPDLDVLPGDMRVKKNRFGAFVPGSSELHSSVAGAQYRYAHHHRDRHQRLLQIHGPRCDDDELQGDLRLRWHRHLQ